MKRNKKPKRRPMRPIPVDERQIQPPSSPRVQAEAEGPGFDPAPNRQYLPVTPPMNPHANLPRDLQRITMQMAALGLNPNIIYPFGYIVPNHRTGGYTVWPTQRALEERRRLSQARYKAEFPPLLKRGEQEAEMTPRKDPPKKLMSSLFAPMAPPENQDDSANDANKNMFFGEEYKLWLSVPASEKQGKEINRQKLFGELVQPSREKPNIYNNEEKLRVFIKNAKKIWENPKFKVESSKGTNQEKNPEDNACNFEEPLERKRSKKNKQFYAYNCSDNEVVEGKKELMKRFLRDCLDHNNYIDQHPIFSHLEHRNRWSGMYNPHTVWNWLL